MALGPQYTPPSLESILSQLDNAAVLERARNVGLGDLLGGGGASMPFNPGSIPMNAGYATGAPNMPYGYGSLETPTTDALLEAMRRRGPYAGGRGFLKGTGAPLGLPRASSAAEVAAGIYGGNPSAINANVIPVTQPSPIPPGAGRGAGAANMPYAQWQQASDDLINSVARQGPYAGTRGWGRASGPAYMAETGYPRQLALPSGQIPNQTGAAGAMTEVPVTRPGSIPAGAGRGTGAGSLPYQGPYEMGPVYEAPVRQSTARNALRNGVASGEPMSFVNPRTSALAQSVEGMVETPVSIRGRNTPNWRSFQGGSNGVGAAGFPTADYVAPTVESAAARTGIRGALAGTGTGLRGAARDAFSPRSGASNMGNLSRFGLGLGIGMGGGALADKLGGSDTVAGQFTEGFSQGGSFGAVGGLPGAIVGGLGVGIGNVASHAIQGRGIESILGGSEEGGYGGQIADYFESQKMGQDAEGNDMFSTEAQIVEALINPEVNAYLAAGIPNDVAEQMQAQVNERLAATDSQTERINILKGAANEIVDYMETGGAEQQLSPTDIASMQIMAAQMMAPVAADAAALGNMQADALQGLMPTLPDAYRQPVQQMIDQAVPHSQRVANAYMQQAYAMPQLDTLNQYQSNVNQTAQQLTAQALSGAMGTGGTGGGDLASLIAGATGGGGSSADIVNALAGG